MKLKKRYLSLISILLFLTIFVTSCSHKAIPTNANTDFSNFTLNMFQQEAAANTIGLHYTLQNPEDYGIKNPPVTYGSFDMNETLTLTVLENISAALKKFPYESLSKENQLTYDVLSSYIDTAIKGVPYSLYEEPLGPVTGIQAQLPVLLAEYRFFSVKDVETYLNLLSVTPDYFSSLIRFEQKKSDAGLFMADYTVDSILKQCNSFLSMGDDNYLLSTFNERVSELDDLSPEQKNEFISRNKEVVQSSVLPAYENLVSALTKLKGTGKNAGGLCNLPKGKDYYSYLVARDTGSSRSVKEITKLIQSQIASDLLDMNTLISANPDIAKQTLSTLPESPSSTIQYLKDGLPNAFPAPADVTTRIKYVPTALEAYLSPAFYMIPPVDNTSENVIYINRGNKMEGINLFTTLAHEGYPGHLYQTTYYAATHPNPLRSILNFSGYVEGWATYTEMCSYSLAPLEKTYASFLQKNNSVILGLYAAADIGIHYNNWDLQKTTDFFQTYGIKNKKTIQDIYEMIISDPANYLKYYVGYVEFLELKKEAMKKENFSQKEFHKSILDIGPAPFDIVRKYLN